jgi:hypothetical protein
MTELTENYGLIYSNTVDLADGSKVKVVHQIGSEFVLRQIGFCENSREAKFEKFEIESKAY